jgi:hypothetical protein
VGESRGERLEIARKRIGSILKKHTVATMRILEQKISDAGPSGQRVDPHILTFARNQLMDAGEILSTRRKGMQWFHLPDTRPDDIASRLSVLGPIHDRTAAQDFCKRSGQSLEIAIYRGLSAGTLHFFGAFLDLDAHDDSILYSKEEPPRVVSGRRLPGDTRLDFTVIHPEAGPAGIEAKNIREWIYPDRAEIMDLLRKCCEIDAVPVLIARRIPYGTFSVLHAAGVLIHQTYNQLYPASDADLAALVRDKTLLGYHDVRCGNLPDPRLRKFLNVDLPALLPEARERFSRFSDLLRRYGNREIDYAEFTARVRRRENREPP